MLLAAEGRSTRSIAEQVGVQPRIVSNWRYRFAEHGLDGLKDRPKGGQESRSTARPLRGSVMPPLFSNGSKSRYKSLLDEALGSYCPIGRSAEPRASGAEGGGVAPRFSTDGPNQKELWGVSDD